MRTAVAVLCCGLSTPALAQPCHPEWSNLFGAFGEPTAPGAITSYDPDGAGPEPERLLVAARVSAGLLMTTILLQEFDGRTVRSTPIPGPASALVAHDDGTGLSILAAVTNSTNTRADIFKRTPAGWLLQGWVDGQVRSMISWDGPTGPMLIVGGAFASVNTPTGATPALNIAAMAGGQWRALGQGLDAAVNDLVVHNDGAANRLYAGGFFERSGTTPLDRIAEFDAKAWKPVGGGVNSGGTFLPAVRSLATAHIGGRTLLIVGGDFTTAGTGAAAIPASNIAAWDGAAWSPLGAGLDFRPDAVAFLDDAIGPNAYAGGWFSTAGGQPIRALAAWNGAAWTQPLPAGPNSSVSALHAINSGPARGLYIQGFLWIGSQLMFSAQSIGRLLDGSLRSATLAPDAPPRALATFAWNGQDRIIAAGEFTLVGDLAAPGLAAWNGDAWETIGTGLDGADVTAAQVLDLDGPGGQPPALYIAGNVTVNGQPALAARWDGTSWLSLAPGSGLGVNSIVAFDDGQGPALYLGGNGAVVRIRAGQSSLIATASSDINDLAVFEDGAGPALYAAGSFATIGGVAAQRIARWNGQSWAPVGGGLQSTSIAEALAVFDGGQGPSLHVAGTFRTAGGIPVSGLARWDGTSWHNVGGGVSGGGLTGSLVRADGLVVHDAGAGPRLYVTGDFRLVGNPPISASYIAAWDGQAWHDVAPGMTYAPDALAWLDDDGQGPLPERLYAAGVFGYAGAHPSRYFARFGCPEERCSPDLTTFAVPGSPGFGVPNGAVNNDDFYYYLSQFAAGNLAVADMTTGAISGSPGYGVPNGILSNDDFFYYLIIFAAGC